MIRRILTVLGVAVLVLIILAVLAATVAFPLIRYLSRPKDLPLAKRNGEDLMRVHGQTIVVVIAHPDDAEWYAGGTLALLVRHGNRVVVVDGTSGEKGGNRPNLGAIREREQRNAGAIIGYRTIFFLHHPDRGLINDPVFRGQLEKIFQEERPSIVLSFDAPDQAFGYRHPDHYNAGAAALEVSEDFDTVRRLYLFSSANPNTIVDVTSVIRIKADALAQHKSQRQESGWARIFLRVLQYLIPQRQTGVGEGAGSAFAYPQIGIEFGEPYRLIRLHEG